ncbi:MAG: hypothetical protein PUE59_11425 [Treponema sp.]|nr:hypothetical protein [Treponema sp.]
MLKQIPERITYAQEKLIKLIEERKLRQWCMENGLQHAAVYRLAIGELTPSYKNICSMVHLIAPIEWLFYTDEKLPYEPQIVPQWNPNNKCKFIKQHRYDYQELSKKYGITELSAYNICVAARAKPSLAFIKECCKDTNPIDFFTDGEEPSEPKSFIPGRGDIVNIHGNICFVLSKKEDIEKDGYITISPIVQQKENAVELSNTKTKGFINPKNIQTYLLGTKCQARFIENVTEEITWQVLDHIRRIFN